MKKKFLSVIISLTMLLLTLIPLSVNAAASGKCGDNLTWVLNNSKGILSISGTGAMDNWEYYDEVPWYSYAKDIKEVYVGDDVTSIGDCAFADCINLLRIELPDNMDSIGESAFANCDSLVSMTIPNKVTTIQNNTFYSCNSLQSITIPNTVTGIGSNAFCFCCELNDVTIPNGVTYIGAYTFEQCTNLKNITIPNTVKSISNYAFSRCTSLTSINIPDSVKYIGYCAFNNCEELTKVNITNLTAWCNIKFDGMSANPLYYSQKLYLNDVLITNLIIPDGVTTVYDYAFENCNSLNSITIPDSVKSIGEFGFSWCANLSNINIGNGVTSIGKSAFNYCKKLSTVNYNGYKKDWHKITKDSGNTYLTNATITFLPISLSVEKNNNEFIVTPNGVENGNQVIFACYNGNKMVYVNPYVYAGESTIPFSTTETYDKVKVMVWENLETCVPLCEAENVPLN